MKKLFQYLFHRDHFIVVASAVLQLGLLGVIAFNLDFLNPVAKALDEFRITDVFFDIQQSGSEPESSELITMVDMTELHSRADIGALLEEINFRDPLFVGVDLIFEGEKDDITGNEILEGAVMGMTGRSVFSSKLTDYDGRKETFTNCVRSYFSDRLDISDAYTNLNDNLSGGRIRDFSLRQSYNGEEIPSFPAAIASVFDHSTGDIDSESIIINYKNVKFPIVRYDEVGEKADLIEDHIVLVGTLHEEQDMHSTPLGKMAGMELQAYSLLTLLEHQGMKEIPKWLSWVIALLLCYLLELSLDLFWQFLKRHKDSGLLFFFKESNLVSIVMFFLWSALVCWVMYIVFMKYNIYLSGGLVLGLMALTCEGRELYKAVVKGIRAKTKSNAFTETSLIKDVD